MAGTVILRHQLPDGSHHFDWMFERSPPSTSETTPPHSDERCLVTFRLNRLPDELSTLDAERISDHRRAFLTFEGSLSADRGNVIRVLTGTCDLLRDDDEGFEAMVRFEQEEGQGEHLWVGSPLAGAIWRLVKHNPVGR